jgi:hypothetical protein
MRFLLVPGLLTLVLTGRGVLAQDDSQRKFQDLFAQYFETCMKDWDTGTHMTKKEWSRTCRRLADQRAKFRLEKGFPIGTSS